MFADVLLLILGSIFLIALIQWWFFFHFLSRQPSRWGIIRDLSAKVLAFRTWVVNLRINITLWSAERLPEKRHSSLSKAFLHRNKLPPIYLTLIRPRSSPILKTSTGPCPRGTVSPVGGSVWISTSFVPANTPTGSYQHRVLPSTFTKRHLLPQWLQRFLPPSWSWWSRDLCLVR